MLRRFPAAGEAPPPPEVQRAHRPDHGAAARRGERSLRHRARHGRRAAVPPPRLRGRARDSAGHDLLVRRDRRTSSARPARRAPSGRRSGAIRSRSSCRAIACSPPAARSAASPRNGGIATKLRLLAIEGAQLTVRRARALRRRRRARLRPDPRRRAPARRRRGARARHRRGRPLPHAAQTDAERLRRARGGDRLPAAQRQGRGNDLRSRLRALPARARVRLPEQILRASDEKLRGAGLSRSKLLSLRDLAQRAEDGAIPTLAEIQGMADETIIERLYRGARHRPVDRGDAADVPPRPPGRACRVDDYGVRKGFAIAFDKRDLPTPQRAREARRRAGSPIARWRAGTSGAWRNGPRRAK